MEDITGKQLGPYQVIAPLGEGGMASVYRAYQPGVERYVALKILPRHFAGDPQFVARFEQEAKMLAQLQHPHILPVFDFGEADGYTYIVMPLLESGDLTDLMQGQPLPLDKIRRTITQIGDALDYAHQRGLIHRDVKPSNVLLDERGNCLLMDFGIAKIVEGSIDLTATGGIIGTPVYMSPEQGLGRKLDGRSDVYALGIILYELVTGRVPYRAETPMAVVVKHINDPLPPPTEVNPNISRALEGVILKALVKNPADRYQTAGEMVKALQSAIPENATGLPGSSGPAETVFATARPTLETPEAGPKRSSKMVWGLAIAAILIVGLGLALVTGAIAFFTLGGSETSGQPTAGVVAELTVTLAAPPTDTPEPPATPTPAPSESPTLEPVEVPEATTETPATPETENPPPAPLPPPAGSGLACLGTFGLGVTCLDETGWQTYTKENSSLGSNLVHAIAACPDNRMVIAHSFGVSAFDGQGWTEYAEGWGASPDNIACDANGGIWVTHFAGVSYFDGLNWTIHSSEKFAAGADPDALVDDLAIAPDGYVWVATSNSIARFDGNEWLVFQNGDGFNEQFFFDGVAVDSQSRPWALHGGGVLMYDGASWTEFENRDITVSKSVGVDAQDQIWVGTFAKGIRVFDGRGGWRTFDTQNSDLSSNRIDLIEVDGQGRVWLGTNWGLNVFDGQEWRVYHMHNADIIDNNIRSMAIAGTGPVLLPDPLEKEPGSLAGRMMTRSGDPLANTLVEICVDRINAIRSNATPCADQPFVLETTTDAEGNFAFADLPTGRYRLAVMNPTTGWVILTKKTAGLESDDILVEPGQAVDLQQVVVVPDG